MIRDGLYHRNGAGFTLSQIHSDLQQSRSSSVSNACSRGQLEASNLTAIPVSRNLERSSTCLTGIGSGLVLALATT